MKTVVRIFASVFFVTLLLGSFAYAAPWFNLMSLGGMDFFKFFKDDATNVWIEASAFHSRINDSYLPSPVDNFNYIRGKTFLGNDTVVVDASGNVWVGTVSPSTKLEVNGQVKIAGGAPWVGKVLTSDAAGLATWTTPASWISGGQTNYVTRWLSATTLGTGALYDNGTNVGIGTAVPGSKLEVSGQILATNVKLTDTTSQSATTGALNINWTAGSILLDDAWQKRISWNDGAGNFNIRAGNYFQAWSGLVYTKGAADANGWAALISFSSDATDGGISLYTSAIGVPWTSVTWANSFSILPTYSYLASNVGIGVVPWEKLDVAGNVKATGYFISTNGQSASTTLANATGYGAFQAQSQWSAGTAGAAFISFHRPSAYAAYFGLDTDNVWKVGWWSMGATSYPLLLGSGYTNPVITGTTPTAAAHLATKAYVDAAVSAAAGGISAKKRAFVTLNTYNGNLWGLAGADAICQTEANASSLGGTWKAILSSSTVNASSRMNYNWSVLTKVDGTPITVAGGMYYQPWNILLPAPWNCGVDTNLTVQCLWRSIDMAPNGTKPAVSYVWSNTSANWLLYSAAYSCSDWTAGGTNWYVGYAGNLNSGWIGYTYTACSTLNRLYCIED